MAEGPNKHPIQLTNVAVLDVDFNAYRQAAGFQPEYSADNNDEGQLRLSFGYTKYDEDAKTISIKATAEIGTKLKREDMSAHSVEENPFYLRLSMIGHFHVDDSQFDIKYIDSWARSNAGLLVYPYLREHVHSLSIRFGFPGVVLPLLQIPTFKKPDSNQEKSD